MKIDSARTWDFDAPPSDVWAALERTDDYRTWWPWLREFDGEALTVGACWNCTVRPPLPYSLAFTIELDEVHPGERIEATLAGDLRGTATIELAPSGSGTTLTLRSELAPTSGVLSAVASVAGPLMRWGHDWVLTTGVRQFRRQALEG